MPLTFSQPRQYRRAKIIADDTDIFMCFPLLPESEPKSQQQRYQKPPNYNNTITVAQNPLFTSEKQYINAPRGYWLSNTGKATPEGSIAVTKGKIYSES